MYNHDRSIDEYRDAINPNPNKPKTHYTGVTGTFSGDPYALKSEQELAKELLDHLGDKTGKPMLVYECVERLEIFQRRLKVARNDGIFLGVLIGLLIGLGFMIASIVRGEM